MEQMEMLWQYQQADVAVDALETEIKRDPARLALKKNREFLVEQQNAVKKMEEEVAQMVDRVDVIKVAIARMEEQLTALTKKMESTPPTDLNLAQDMSRDAQKLLGDLTEYEQELMPSFALVWPSNSASCSLTEITQMRPSRTSAPERFSSLSFSRPWLRP